MGTGTFSRSALPLAVLAAAVLVFAGTLGHELVWDDPRLYEVAEVRLAEGGVASLLATPFALSPEQDTAYYRPLVMATLALDTLFGEHRAAAAHATNVLLHGACSALVSLLLLSIGLPRHASFLAALLFALHPAHVESVAFVSGRTDLLATLFVLLSVWLFVRDRSGAARRPRLERTGSTIAFLLACLSKESALLLPAVLVLWEFLRFPRAERSFRGLAPYALVVAGILVLRGTWVGTPLLPDPSVRDPSNVAWSWGTLPEIYGAYARILLWPWPLRAFYTPDQLGGLALGAGFVALLVAAALGSVLRSGSAALVWIAIFLLPVAGIVPIGGAIVAERFLYLPSVGLAILAAGLVRRVRTARARPVLVGVAVLMLATSALLTIARARVWENDLTLFENVARTTPRYPEGRMNLAIEYGKRGRHEEAIRRLEEVVRERPRSDMALVNLGVQHAGAGRLDAAIARFRTALALNPRSPEALFNLGLAETASGRPREAEAAFRALVEVVPSRGPGWHGLGVALLQLGSPREAEDALRTALRTGADRAETGAALGHALLEQGRLEEARRAFGSALETDPSIAAAIYGSGLALARSGRRNEALGAAARLDAIDPALAKRLREALAE